MAKKLKVSANQRIDIPDFKHGTADYPAELHADQIKTLVRANRNVISEGFRVQLANQTSNPGQISVFNGVAFDKDGNVLTNRDQVNDARNVTLSGSSTTFYVEVEYTEVESDVDSRAFMDPTAANTTPIPPGREVSLNVATRLSPDWRIVTPVSTSGFEVDSDPNSTRIPVAVLATNASNEITAAVNPGLTLVHPSTKLEEGAQPADVQVKVFDSRLFPTTGNVTVGVGTPSSETVALTNNDRVNGILTVAALANAHEPGAVVRVSGGTPSLVEERLSIDPESGDQDFGFRLWRGNEDRGAAILSSKETPGARDDLDVRGIKDYIDSIAGVVKEMKSGAFGAGDPNSTVIPLASDIHDVKYYDPVGSLTGIRTATVTIGDGVTTIGDYNGTDQAPFVAAAAAVTAAGGGTVFVKSGTYTFTSPVNLPDSIAFFGQGRSLVVVENNTGSDAPCFVCSDTSGEYKFLGMSMVAGTNAFHSIATAGALSLVDCVVQGVDGSASASVLSIKADGTTFVMDEDGEYALDCPLSDSRFEKCTFLSNGDDSGWVRSDLVDAHMRNISFEHCKFEQTVDGAPPFLVDVGIGIGTLADVLIRSCHLTLRVDDSYFAVFGFPTPPRTNLIQFIGTNPGNSAGVTVLDCVFQDESQAASAGSEPVILSSTWADVVGCAFYSDAGTSFGVLVALGKVHDCLFHELFGGIWGVGGSSIARNTAVDCPLLLSLAANPVAEGIEIVGNRCSNTSSLASILLFGSTNSAIRVHDNIVTGPVAILYTGDSNDEAARISVQGNLVLAEPAASFVGIDVRSLGSDLPAAIAVANNQVRVYSSADDELYGIRVSGSDPDDARREVSVTNNVVTMVGPGGASTEGACIFVSGGRPTYSRYKISGNSIRWGFLNAVTTTSPGHYAIAAYWTVNLFITDNLVATLPNAHTTGGIRVYNDLQQANTTVRGNQMRLTGPSGGSGVAAIMLSPPTGGYYSSLLVAENNITLTSGGNYHGITCVLVNAADHARGLSFLGNVIRETSVYEHRVLLSVIDNTDEARNISVCQNVLHGAATPSATRSVACLTVSGALQGILVSDNNIVGWGDQEGIRVAVVSLGAVNGNHIEQRTTAGDAIVLNGGVVLANSNNVGARLISGTGAVSGGGNFRNSGVS